MSPAPRFTVSPVQPYESYALDAIDWYDPEKEQKALKSRVTEFLRAGLTAQTETRPSVGTGTDYRLSSEKVTGFALCLDGKILHLSIFAKSNGTGRASMGSKIARYSRRSRVRI